MKERRSIPIQLRTLAAAHHLNVLLSALVALSLPIALHAATPNSVLQQSYFSQEIAQVDAKTQGRYALELIDHLKGVARTESQIALQLAQQDRSICANFACTLFTRLETGKTSIGTTDALREAVTHLNTQTQFNALLHQTTKLDVFYSNHPSGSSEAVVSWASQNLSDGESVILDIGVMRDSVTGVQFDSHAINVTKFRGQLLTVDATHDTPTTLLEVYLDRLPEMLPGSWQFDPDAIFPSIECSGPVGHMTSETGRSLSTTLGSEKNRSRPDREQI